MKERTGQTKDSCRHFQTTSCLEHNDRYTRNTNKRGKCGKFSQENGIYLVSKAVRNSNHVDCISDD